MVLTLLCATGAGWVTYAPKNASNEFLVFMLTYEPLIRALENRANKGSHPNNHHRFMRMLTIDPTADRLEELLKGKYGLPSMSLT